MSSPLPEQSEKNKKYDRQIRLWGLHGQNYLECAKVCLINANCIGCEILKSIVLPGIGSFTIVDTHLVTLEDVGINFFIDADHMGQSRAYSAMTVLQELNADVRGDFVNESIEYILANRPEFFGNFDFVIASNLNESSLLSLSRALWDADVPFIYCRSLGIFGSIRLQIKEHCVIETHIDLLSPDLRIEKPFPALQKYLETTEITHKVPWPVVMYQYLQKWRAANTDAGSYPQTYKERCEFRQMILEAMGKNQENFYQASQQVNNLFGHGTVKARLKEIFDNPYCKSLTAESKPFWIMAYALKEFIEHDNNNLLPIAGKLPDMIADTEHYITLQNIYRQQALQDADAVYRKAQTYLKELGLPPEMVSELMVRQFCREIHGVTVQMGSPITMEYEKANPILFNNIGSGENTEDSCSLNEFYICMRAFERYVAEFGSPPGETTVENDLARLKTTASKMLTDWGAPVNTLNDNILHEICRCGGAELHSVSSFIGGCAAHEVIKILSQQYLPIDNTFIYDGITTNSVTLKL